MLKALGFLPSLPQINYKIENLEKVISAAPLEQGKEGFEGRDHTVEFQDVSFAYEQEMAADHVSFTICQGWKTALVGESGSGKSTLAKLLVHYYDINEGSISIGGQDIRRMSLEALNDQNSYVAKEQNLFNTSQLENNRLGKP